MCTIALSRGYDVHGTQHVFNQRCIVLRLSADRSTSGSRSLYGSINPDILYRTTQFGCDTRAPVVGSRADVDGHFVSLSIHDAIKPVADVQPESVCAVVHIVHELTVEILVVQRFSVGQPKHVVGILNKIPSVVVALYEFIIVVAREVLVVRAVAHITTACSIAFTNGAETCGQFVRSRRTASGSVAVGSTLHFCRTVALSVGRTVNLLVVAKGKRIVVLANVLTPIVLALVVVQQEASLTALHIFGRNLRSTCGVTKRSHVVAAKGLAYVAGNITGDNRATALLCQLEVIDDKTVLDTRLTFRPSDESTAVGTRHGGNLHGRYAIGQHTVSLRHANDTSVSSIARDTALYLHVGNTTANDASVPCHDTGSKFVLGGNGTGRLQACNTSLIADVAEQSRTIARVDEHVQLDGVALAVKATHVPSGVHANLRVLETVVNVGRQDSACIHLATVHQLGKSLQVCSRTNLVHTVHLVKSPYRRASEQHHAHQAHSQ